MSDETKERTPFQQMAHEAGEPLDRFLREAGHKLWPDDRELLQKARLLLIGTAGD